MIKDAHFDIQVLKAEFSTNDLVAGMPEQIRVMQDDARSRQQSKSHPVSFGAEGFPQMRASSAFNSKQALLGENDNDTDEAPTIGLNSNTS
jgi:hypothetical protein